MELKRRKSLFLIVAIPILLFFSFVTLDKEKISVIKHDTLQKIMSLDLGFSSLRNLINTGENKVYSQNDKLLELFKNIPEILRYKFDSNYEFERIEIDIDFDNYLLLMNDRSRALEDKLLTNPSKVNAKLTFRGEKYKAELRLKGDLFGHWKSKYRHSLRIELKKNKSILGFSAFSIQKPRERQHPYDYVFQSIVRDIGGLAPVHKFAHIFVNGEDWGIMDIEEHVSKQFLEKQNRKDSIIVRFGNEENWIYGSDLYKHYRLSSPYLYSNLYNQGTYLKDFHNRKLYSYILKNQINRNTKIFDKDSMYKAYILSRVWNSVDTTEYPNSRYYLNPYTLKLEIITTDQKFWSSIDNDSFYYVMGDRISSKFDSNDFYRNLDILDDLESNINEHLSYTQSLFPLDQKKSTEIISNNIKLILDEKEKYLISPIMNYISENEIKNNHFENPILPTSAQASDFKKHLYIRHYSDGRLELYNLIPDKVIVKSISFNNQSFQENEIIVPSYLSSNSPLIIQTPFKGIHDGMFEVNTEYQGFERSAKNNLTLVSEGIKNPLLVDNANEFNFINKLDENKYEIKPGDWSVKKPIIINGNLNIFPGVNLNFSSDSYIIVKGSITAFGSETSPITFRALSDSWKGIYVLNAVNRSHLKNVFISNITSLEDDLLKLTGGVTFYNSDVDFENLYIKNVSAEDAINIVKSSFNFKNVNIDSTISDGFDSDFSDGVINLSNFSMIGGDALDFSGSEVLINETEISNVRDKAISAGEKSSITINNSNFKNVGVGLASKDASFVTMADTSILNYDLYAAMSYVKKDFFGSSEIVINRCSVSDGDPYLRQEGTSMMVDGKYIAETKVNVERLYKTEVMTK
ncbi:CotH kinase family protein [Candidatus Pseudothioglobus singularis]|nr:CotH kinase family protein [Candidatus Pseudothioglobus singularis]